jgi:hypothetical protein
MAPTHVAGFVFTRPYGSGKNYIPSEQMCDVIENLCDHKKCKCVKKVSVQTIIKKVDQSVGKPVAIQFDSFEIMLTELASYGRTVLHSPVTFSKL